MSPPARPGTRRKADKWSMQRANRALILSLVRGDPTQSRATLARHTGLSPAAVGAIVDYLIGEGLVSEGPAPASRSLGRRPVRLRFNPGARQALGIAVDIREVSAALVDLGGRPSATLAAAVPAHAGPDTVLDIAASLARRALRNAPAERMLGVGMAVPGMVQWPDGINLFSPNFAWHDVAIRALMEERLGRPVLVDNEVRAVALAEHHFGAAREARTAVFVDVGYGVGGAIILDGSLYRGVHGAAGEIGHNTVEPGGPLCGCGNRGCLEVFASAHGLVARALDMRDAGAPSALDDVQPEHLSIDRIAAAASSGDAVARALLNRAATYLGLAVANAVDNWDPELVVLSGPVIRAGGDLFATLLSTEQRSVLETGRARVRVRRAAIAESAKVIGAASLLMTDYLSEPRLVG